MINDVSSALNAYQQALGRLSGMTQAKSSVAAEDGLHVPSKSDHEKAIPPNPEGLTIPSYVISSPFR